MWVCDVVPQRSVWDNTDNENSIWARRHKLGNNTGGAKSTTGPGTLVYKGVKLQRVKIGLNQSLIYIHPFPPVSLHTTQIFT